MDDEVLEIRVGNTYDPGAKVKKGTGTGLRNITARLLNLYGTSSLIKINQSDEYFEVILRIPKHAR
jgi:LytS/YehU family sensor histidine kinase